MPTIKVDSLFHHFRQGIKKLMAELDTCLKKNFKKVLLIDKIIKNST